MSTTIENASPAPAAARRVDQLLAHYEESHRNATNEKIHFVAIPLIMLSILGLLYALHPYVAYVFLAASMVYYVRLSLVLVAVMTVWTVIMLALVWAMGPHVVKISVALFVGGWIAQFIGHKLEGRKPSFFEDIQYLWVGPLFVVTRAMIKLGIRW